MELLFYLIIVVVIAVKLLFWTMYLCIRRRRQRSHREGSRAIETCYEEIPAIPQPAYTFSGLSPEDLRQALLIETLPGYQHDDPFKTDHPPPAYEQSFHSTTDCSVDVGTSNHQSGITFDEMVRDIETNDVCLLLENQADDFICLQNTNHLNL